MKAGEIYETNISTIEIIAVLGPMVFIRHYFADGSQGPYQGPYDPEDLYVYGYRLKEESKETISRSNVLRNKK